MSSWQDIDFSVDLIESALNQLDFLEQIDKLRLVFEGDIIKKAIFRYEKLWLPFYAQHREIVYPPTDVLWIWHCHMLSPTEYYHDLMNLFGEILDHSNLTKEEMAHKQEITKLLWESELKCSYDYLELDSVNELFINFRSDINYDLKKASKIELEYYYQVSLPHFTAKEYLNLALDRYKKFLHLAKTNPSLFIVPCYAIDLMWRTHQLNPISYLNDCTRVLGGLFERNDAIINSAPGRKLDLISRQTIILWRETYNEEFFFPGAMYRGKRPSEQDYSNSQIPILPFVKKLAKFELKEMSLNSIGGSTHHKTLFEISLFKEQNLAKIPIFTNRLIQNDSFVRDIRHIQLVNDAALELILNVKFIEPDAKSKIKNVFKTGHRHDKSFDKHFEFEIKFPKTFNKDEVQEVKHNLINQQKEEFVLKSLWNVCLDQSRVQFLVDKKEFKTVNMNQIKHNYRN